MFFLRKAYLHYTGYGHFFNVVADWRSGWRHYFLCRFAEMPHYNDAQFAGGYPN